MPFDLNEAPDIALSAIASHRTARGCGTLFSAILCLPALGCSIGLCDNNPQSEYIGCFFPRSLTTETDAGLTAVQDTLRSIRLNPSVAAENDAYIANSRAFIRWQVTETINVLQRAIDDNVIQGGYHRVIGDALTNIRTRALQEQRFTDAINEKMPLTGCDAFHFQHYGLAPSSAVK